jgi:hypothetical protein
MYQVHVIQWIITQKTLLYYKVYFSWGRDSSGTAPANKHKALSSNPSTAPKKRHVWSNICEKGSNTGMLTVRRNKLILFLNIYFNDEEIEAQIN